ncbi:MAG: hypothetical protein ACLU8J_04620 [Acutalibacter sp.]
MKQKTIVGMVKRAWPVGYGRRFTAEKPTKVATLCAGQCRRLPPSAELRQGIVEIKGSPARCWAGLIS